MSRRTVSVLTFIFFIILVALLWIFSRSQASIQQAEQETIAIVEGDYAVETVHDFYWMSLEESYFSLFFQDGDGQDRYAIVSQDGGEVEYYASSALISEEDALSLTKNYNEVDTFLNSRLGMLNGQPVWEVSFKAPDESLVYYYINASNGEWMQTIGNL